MAHKSVSWLYTQRFINFHSTTCRLLWRGKGSLSSWSLALRAGVLRRAVSHTARPHFAVCHFIGWRGPLKLDRLSEIHRPSAPVTQIQMALVLLAFGFKAARAVRPNHSLNRTHCSVPSFGLKKPSPNASPPQWAG